MRKKTRFLIIAALAVALGFVAWALPGVDPGQTARKCGQVGQVQTLGPDAPVLRIVQESPAPEAAQWGRKPVPSTVDAKLPSPPSPSGDDRHGARRIETALAATLYEQAGSPGGESYVDQVFGDYPTMSAYLADDFANGTPWSIQTIYVTGEGAQGYTSLLNATALTWSIYPATGPTPPGYSGTGAVPYWTLTLLPTDPQVTYTNGVLGYPSNVTLDLASPVTLPAGNWWFEFVPTMVFSTGGQWYWTAATTSNGSVAQFINPGGGWGQGAGWVDFTWMAPGFHDLAFRFEGCTAVGAVTLADGSFEAGSPNPHWTETSTNFGSPLCTVGSCGNGAGSAGPRSGLWWAWFGGYYGYEHGTLSQAFTVPAGRPAALSFWFWNGWWSGDGTDYLDVLVDGAQVFHAVEGNPAYTGGYVQVTVDLSAYADGASHLLMFDSIVYGPENSNFSVDDVSLSIGCCGTITLSPTVLPPMTVGHAYSQTLTATGGTGPYSFAVTGGTLPAGLTLDPGGVLSGTPTASGAYSFTVTATDAGGCTGEITYSGTALKYYFLDDYARSKFCVDTLTGAYIWNVTSGPESGTTYTGTARILNGGARVTNMPGDPSGTFSVVYDPVRSKASGYLVTALGHYVRLADANTANNAGGCD